jgi:hypothetical protein
MPRAAPRPRPRRLFQGHYEISSDYPLPRAGPAAPEEVDEWERSAEADPAAAAKDVKREGRDDDATDQERLQCTPWRDRRELLAVRDLLYARVKDEDDDAEGAAVKKRRLGVSTVSVPSPLSLLPPLPDCWS